MDRWEISQPLKNLRCVGSERENILCVLTQGLSYHLLHLQWLAGGQILSAHSENLWVEKWVLHLTWWVPLGGVPRGCDIKFAAPSTSALAQRQGRYTVLVCLQHNTGSSTWVVLRMLSGDVQEAHPGENGVAMHPQCSTAGISQCWKPTQAPGTLSCFAFGATQRNVCIQTCWQ